MQRAGEKGKARVHCNNCTATFNLYLKDTDFPNN